MKQLPILIPTKQIDWQKVKFNCCSVGNLFVDPKEKAAKERGELGETAKKWLIKAYLKEYWGRQQKLTTKFTDKGLLVEEDLLTLISRAYKRYYVKNKEKRANDWIKGYTDIVDDIDDLIIDGKASWSAETFLPQLLSQLDNIYKIQMQGYMWLWDKPKARVDFGLVSAPESILNKEKYFLLRNMDVVTEESPEFKEAVAELERNMVFDDIPMEERIISFFIDRDEKVIERIPVQVQKARNFLESFQDLHMRKPKKLIEITEEVLA